MDTSSPLESRSTTPLFWLHVPNTGTSFGNTLVRWACNASLNNVVEAGKVRTASIRNWEHCKHHFVINHVRPKHWPIGDHIPLSRRITIRSLHSVVSLFRGPERRGKPKRVQSCESMRRNNLFGMQTQYVLGYKPPGPGGETKSLLSRNVSMQDADRACFRLQQFAFVGITDLWQASICLFHKQLGGIDDSQDYSNVRPTKRGKGRKESFKLERNNCPDFVDDQLFNCALDRFLSRIMWTACAHLLEPADLGSRTGNAKLNALLNTNSTL